MVWTKVIKPTFAFPRQLLGIRLKAEPRHSASWWGATLLIGRQVVSQDGQLYCFISLCSHSRISFADVNWCSMNICTVQDRCFYSDIISFLFVNMEYGVIQRIFCVIYRRKKFYKKCSKCRRRFPAVSVSLVSVHGLVNNFRTWSSLYLKKRQKTWRSPSEGTLDTILARL